MARILTNYLNKITTLDQKIDEEIDQLLEVIDLDELLANPQLYMQELSKQFFESLEDEIKEAIEAGEAKANQIITAAKDLNFDLTFNNGAIAESVKIPIGLRFFWPDA